MNEKKEIFETYPIGRAVMSMALPTVLSSLVMILYNLADTYFVGALGDSVETAAVTLAAPVILAFNAVINLFGVGCSTLMGRALGRGDEDTVRRTATFGVYCTVIFGVLFSVICTVFMKPLLALLGADETNAAATAQYMKWTVCLGATPSILNVVLSFLVRAEGRSVHASIGSMCGCALNIILDPFFILPFGLGMKAAGAGCATFISNCVACTYFAVLLIVKRRETYISAKPKYFTLRRDIVTEVLKVGFPAAIQNLLNVTSMTVLNNFAAVNDDAVAAMGIAQKVNNIALYFVMGISAGVTPLLSYNYGSGDIKRMRGITSFTAKLMLAISVPCTAAFFAFSRELVWLFMKVPAVADYGSRFLHGFSLGLPFIAMDFLAVGVFQASGRGEYSLIFALLRKIVLEIPALIIWNKLVPLYGLPFAIPTAEVIMAAFAAIMLVRFYRKQEKEKAVLGSFS